MKLADLGTASSKPLVSEGVRVHGEQAFDMLQQLGETIGTKLRITHHYGEPVTFDKGDVMDAVLQIAPFYLTDRDRATEIVNALQEMWRDCSSLSTTDQQIAKEAARLTKADFKPVGWVQAMLDANQHVVETRQKVADHCDMINRVLDFVDYIWHQYKDDKTDAHDKAIIKAVLKNIGVEV